MVSIQTRRLKTLEACEIPPAKEQLRRKKAEKHKDILKGNRQALKPEAVKKLQNKKKTPQPEPESNKSKPCKTAVVETETKINTAKTKTSAKTRKPLTTKTAENTPEALQPQVTLETGKRSSLLAPTPQPAKVPKKRGRPPGRNVKKIISTAEQILKSLESDAAPPVTPIIATDLPEIAPSGESLASIDEASVGPSVPKKRGRKKKNPEDIYFKDLKSIDSLHFEPRRPSMRGRPAKIMKMREMNFVQNVNLKLTVHRVLNSVSLKVARKFGFVDLEKLDFYDLSVLKEKNPSNAFVDIPEETKKYPTGFKKPSSSAYARRLDAFDIFQIHKPLEWINGINMRLLLPPMPSFEKIHFSDLKNPKQLYSSLINNRSLNDVTSSAILDSTNKENSETSVQSSCKESKIDDSLLIGRVCSPPRSKSETRQAFAPDLKALAEMLRNQGHKELGRSRPPFSLATLVYMALVKGGGRHSCPARQGLTLSEICSWIAEHFEFYRFELKRTLENPKDVNNIINKIRLTLLSNKCFQKISRSKADASKSYYWILDPTYSTISIYKQFYDADQEQFQNDFYSLYNMEEQKANADNQSEANAEYNYFDTFNTEYLGEHYNSFYAPSGTAANTPPNATAPLTAGHSNSNSVDSLTALPPALMQQHDSELDYLTANDSFNLLMYNLDPAAHEARLEAPSDAASCYVDRFCDNYDEFYGYGTASSNFGSFYDQISGPMIL